MTHAQYDLLNRTEQVLHDELEAAVRHQSGSICTMIRNNLQTAPRFRLMLLTLRDMLADNEPYIRGIIGEQTADLVLEATADSCDCEGYCWHAVTV